MRDQAFVLIPLVGLIGLFTSTLTRLSLLSKYGSGAGIGGLDLIGVLLIGIVNDLAALLIAFAPLTLVLLLWPRRRAGGRILEIFSAWVVWSSTFAFLFLAAAEVVFFDEFQSRFNLVAVDYLIYPHEVVMNIRDSYPVPLIATVAVVLACAITYAFWPVVQREAHSSASASDRLKFSSVYLMAAIAFVPFSSFLYGRYGNRIAREISENGLATFAVSFVTNELEYPDHYRTEDRALAYGLLRETLTTDGTQLASDDTFDIRRVSPGSRSPKKLNVVVVAEESLGCEFVGSCGGKPGLTPNIDRLSKESLFFSNAYATGTRTVRGLEAISASFPPIPSESIVKRPGSEGIANWGAEMQENGYQTSFLYGGYGTFDKMNHYFSSNGFDISDRTDIDKVTFATIWGVADENLFDHAIKYFNQRAATGQPFFSIVMSTSNHRPFKFPEGIPGVAPEGGGRDAGARYADYALGRFLEDAKKTSWFDDTIFVILADHGARVYGSAEFPLPSYHIPMLIYSPSHVKPEDFALPASQIDLAPTVMGMLGLRWSAPFFGKNILEERDPERELLLNHNHEVALIRGDRMVVLGLNRAVAAYRIDQETGEQFPIAIDQHLVDLATAYYQTAYELFHEHRYL